MTKLSDVLLRRGAARFAKPLPVISPKATPEFFRIMLKEIAAGNLYPDIPAQFAGKLEAIGKPLAWASVLALRQLAQGLPVDRALIVEYLGRYTDDFLRAFNEVVRPAARSALEVQKSATEILTRLDAHPTELRGLEYVMLPNRLERAERFDRIVDAVMREKRASEIPYESEPGALSDTLRWAEAELRALEKEAPLRPREKAFAAFVEESIQVEVEGRFPAYQPIWEAFAAELVEVPLEVYWDLLAAYPWGEWEGAQFAILERIAQTSPAHGDLFERWWEYGKWAADPQGVYDLDDRIVERPPRPRRWTPSP